MPSPRAITDAEFERLAEKAKAKNVRVRYQRGPDMPIVEIIPDIPKDRELEVVDGDEEIVL